MVKIAQFCQKARLYTWYFAQKEAHFHDFLMGIGNWLKLANSAKMYGYTLGILLKKLPIFITFLWELENG